MNRREFIGIFGGAAVMWPVTVRAQQPGMPVVGFLRSSTADSSSKLLAAFRRGLQEAGFSDGQNVTIEYRWAENKPERLPSLATNLVQRGVAVTVAGGSGAPFAAKEATSIIPIVFVSAIDPVKTGLVASLNRPGANITGVSYLTSALGGKRLEFLHLLAPAAKTIGTIVNPSNPTSEPLVQDLKVGARILGLEVVVATVADESEFEEAFASLVQKRSRALVMGADPMFTRSAEKIVSLADRYALPAIYTIREFAEAGGLMTWGTSLTEQYRQAGLVVAKILKGEHPADMPVLQPTKYELVLNLKTAKALGMEVPPKLLALADEVIE